MKKFMYAAPLLIGLTASLSAAPEGQGLTAQPSLKSAVNKIRLGGLFSDIQSLVASMNQVTTQIDTVTSSVDTELASEYATYNNFATNLNNTLDKSCFKGSDTCNNDPNGPNYAQISKDLTSLKTIAIPTYQTAVASLPKQTDVTSAVNAVSTTVNNMDKGDQAQLQTFETNINTAQANVVAAVNAIYGILSDIESASKEAAPTKTRK